jgi:hypothetical protein
MDKEEYIQYLVDKGLSDEEINTILDEIEDPDSTPKKKKDPVKTETSMGSKKDTVSNSDPGLSGLSEADVAAFIPFGKEAITIDKQPWNPNQEKQEIYKPESFDGMEEAYSFEESKKNLEYMDKLADRYKLTEEEEIIWREFKTREQEPEIQQAFADNASQVEEEFELKEKSIDSDPANSWNRTGFSSSMATSKGTRKTIQTRSAKANQYIERARKQLQKRKKFSPEYEILDLARQLRLDDLNNNTKKRFADEFALEKQEEGKDKTSSERRKAVLDKNTGFEVFYDNREYYAYMLDNVQKKITTTNKIKEAELKGLFSDQEGILKKANDFEQEVEAFKNNKNATKRDFDLLIDKQKQMLDDWDSNYKLMEEISNDLSNIGDFNTELDSFKRQQGFLNNFAPSLVVGVEKTFVAGGLGAAEWLIDMRDDLLKTYADPMTLAYLGVQANTEDNTIFGDMSEAVNAHADKIAKTIKAPDSLESVKSWSQLLEWTAEGVVQNLPQLAVVAATGGEYLGPMILASTAAGGKYMETLKDHELNQINRYLAAGGAFAIEFGSELVTAKLWKQSTGAPNRVMRAVDANIAKTEARSLKEIYKSKILKAAKAAGGFSKATAAGMTEEAMSEAFAAVGNNLNDMYTLGKKDVNIFDGVAEGALVGAAIGGMITTVPNIGSHILAPFIETKTVSDNLNKIKELKDKRSNIEDINVRRIIQTQIDELIEENKEIAMGGLKIVHGVSDADVREMHETYDQMQDIKDQYKKIKNDNTKSNSQKSQELEVLERQYEKLQNNRNSIIEKSKKAIEQAWAIADEIEVITNMSKDFDKLEIDVANNPKEAKELREKWVGDQTDADGNVDLKEFDNGYIIRNRLTGEQRIVINAHIAMANNSTSVAGHEFIHAILWSTVKNNYKIGDKLAAALKVELRKIDPKILREGKFKERYDQYLNDKDYKRRSEEVLTLFFEGVKEGYIKLDESLATKTGDNIRMAIQNIPGLGNIKFNKSTDVLNFIKDFNSSLSKGKLTRAQKEMLEKGAKGRIVEMAKPLSEEEAAEQANEELQFAASKVATNTGKPKAIFMIGGAGSGKSNIVNMLNLGWKQVNEDLATEPLKKEAGLPESEADYTSEQLSQRAKIGAQARKQAKEKLAKYTASKENMIIDGTGASYNATTKKMQALRDAGYDVSIIYAKTSLDVAKQRNKDRKERSLREDIVERNHADVNANIDKYKNDLGDNFFEINTDQIEYAQPLPRDFMNKVNQGIGQTAASSKVKDTVLESINDLIPENIETQADLFSDARAFTNIYNAIDQDGGVINNYIKSRSSSAAEAELAIESVKDRLMNFDPQAKRKDGSTIGIEGFGEFIFANTAFGKLDAKKKLYEESQRKSQETSIDESVKQIADTPEVTTEETTFEKRKATINPLKFTGAPEKITLSDKPGKGLTFKNVGKKYAGEVGEQILGIPAKKITEASANLGSVNEARAIQQFFFKADNLEKFLKILPETNIVLPEAQIGLEKLDISKQVKGTGLGIPKRVLDYFYEDFIDPTGKLTSPKGRSKGLTSQVPVKRLNTEFRGTISNETINKLKRDIGITPRGELNILPKGELRSPIGQLLKGLAKTYSTLAANTLVRQELQATGASKQEIANVAGGKKDVMASKGKPKITNVDNIDVDAIMALSAAASINDTAKYLNIKNKITVTENNREQKLKEANDLIEKGKITTAQLEAVKLFNFGRLYERRNGVKYYKLKDGSFVKDKSKEYLDAERQGLFVAARGSLYYGKSDPAYKIAFELAQKNDSDLRIPKAKRVKARDAFSDKADEQFSINIDVLEGLVESLASAVHVYGLPIETAALFITSSYQATTGLIKISGKFKYESDNAEYAGPLGKPNQNKGEKFIEEHSVPASTIGAVLIYAISENAAKPVMQLVRNSFIQVKLGKQYDMLVDKAGLASKLPDGFSIIDNNALRYIMAGIMTKDMPGMPSMDMNAQVDPTTGKTWAQDLGIDLPLKYRTKKNLDLQNELLLDLLTDGGKYSNHQQYLNEAVELDNAKAVGPNNKMASKAGVMSSKSNEQVVNNLNNYDKALRNAKNPKALTKGITVFDFDDTLATSNSLVDVTMPDGETFKIDATEFAKRGDALLAQGAEFDFSDFSKVIDGEPGPLMSKLEKAINKFGNKDVYVLTARPANSASAIYEFLKSLGYEIPLENITGLANSSPEAKAQWMVDKAALGYNDFYFVDDAYKNVKAVQDAMSALDVKSKERIAYKDRFEKLDKEFNDILENKTGIASEKEYSDAKAEVVGVDKGKFNFFISPSAEDFVGLLYSTLGKGKLGENQMAWYKKNLLDPYTRAMNNIASERMSLAADYKALKKQLGVVPNKLRNKIKGEGFTQEQAVRIYIWNKQGMEVPGLSKTDLSEMTKYVQNNPKLNVFADQLVEITKGDGYAMPFENWMTGSITTDLLSTLQVTKRAKHLEEWQRNIDVIFSKKNLNKLEAAYGSTYRGAVENILQRMKTGKNRGYDGDSLTGRFLDWVNGSTGAIMFFNTRSAILQTISAVNFVNWSDNNIFKASAAFANQPQYWKDFKELFMSDFLKERRDNLTININESDIAEMANKGGVRGAIGYILQKGFLPTQFADGFAIASGGATFYRNRINTYIKEGLSEKEAKEKAFNDFRELTEESQQSSRPDRISQQQAGPLGRIVLAFANTPSQYARIIKKATLDLANNRGDFKTNLSKIMYYSVIQGVIFNALQSALFAADFDDEEEISDRTFKMGNSIADGILRGMGTQGAVTSVVKNATLKALEESEKSRPKYDKVVNEILRISPPVSSKISKLQQSAREIEWNKKEMKSMGWSLENPAWIASANVLSATTNIPADRVVKKINNITYAATQDIELYERLALLGGWQKWELGLAQKDIAKKKAQEKAIKEQAKDNRKKGIIKLKNDDSRIKLKPKSRIKLK